MVCARCWRPFPVVAREVRAQPERAHGRVFVASVARWKASDVPGGRFALAVLSSLGPAVDGGRSS
jgi:hypothetical protein